MSDRTYVAGQDGDGDYYVAPQPQSDYSYYDPYFSGFNFNYGFGFASPFGYGPFGYSAWWNAWPYVSPPHHNPLVLADPPPPAQHKRRPEFRQTEWQHPAFPAPGDSATDRRERGVGPAALPRGPAREPRRGDSPIP